MFGVQNAVAANVCHIHFGVLCVEVVDGVAEVVNYFNDVHTLPDKVRRIEVCADHRPYRIAQTKQRFGIINAEAGVHFERNLLHAVLFCEFHGVFPIGNQHLVPLIVQNIEVFRRPRAGYPVGLFGIGISAGATGEGYDTFNADLSGENASRLEVLLECFRDFFIGMNAVSVHRDCRNGGVILFESIHQFFTSLWIVNELFGVRVHGSGISAHAEFELMNAVVSQIFKAFVQRHSSENAVYNA